MEGDLEDATKNLNFNAASLPTADFVSFHNLHAELLPSIRRMIDRVRQVKNAFDDNANQESGTLDMQSVIQAMAQRVQRNDLFCRDENLSKDECWTILIDSSLSLSGSSRQIKAIAICLAESANQTLGQGNPWAMFTFSDDFYCIKNYEEPYDNMVKARIGGLKQSGLSYIPDALKAATNLAKKHAKDKNFIILVSDGVPSGYIGIEKDFTLTLNQIAKTGVNIAAIGVGSSTIKKVVRNAKVVDEPLDLVNGFMDMYSELAS
jgi:nitric oxide reductase activation protein